MTNKATTVEVSLCFTCKVKPAGHGDYYRHSAYCYTCQPMPKALSGANQDRESDALFNR